MDKNIIISGRACRLPGANNYAEFSQLLLSGKCSVTSIPQDRWASSRFYHPEPNMRGKAYTQAAGVLDDIWSFDPKPFNISPREADQMDPQQKILLQVVWQALESANLKPSDIANKNVGVFVGASSMEFGTRLMYDPELSDIYNMTGSTLSIIANRISYIFNLKGPSLTVDTACSSSLVAMNEAYTALKSGRIDTAIVAGVNILLNPIPYIGFSAGKFLSPTGLCHSFSNDADGYVRSEGAVALILQNEGTKIGSVTREYGRLLGIDVNSDGRTSGIALPKSEAQEDLLKSVYEKSDVDPEQLSFVEAHGTGTQVGDAAEANAIGNALGKVRKAALPIGSVKSNIGHLEPVSGLAGVLKSLIAFEYKVLPQSLHLENANELIDFEKKNISLASKAVNFSSNHQRLIAGVSSFGFGGTNAHAILGASETQDSKSTVFASKLPAANEAMLFTSAFCEDALRASAETLAGELSENPENAQALCSALVKNRDANPHRLVVLGEDGVSLKQEIQSYLDSRKSLNVFEAKSSFSDEPSVFTYSGNGAQYAGMSISSYQNDPFYKKHYDKVSSHFEAIAKWSLVEMMNDEELDKKIMQASVAQPMLFADQVALSFALADRGLKPHAVLGHSGGEIAAAHVCGSLDLDQALLTIFERSKSQELLAGKGTMAALQASADDVQEELEKLNGTNITIAAFNSPRNVTLVGPADELDEFRRIVKRTRRWAGLKLPVEYPYHSPMQDEIEELFRDGLKYITPAKNEIPFFSCVYGEKISGETLNVDYWWLLLREPVKFMDSIKAARADGYKVFIECGPKPVLTSYINDSLSHSDELAQTTFTHEENDTANINPISRSICRAFANGALVDKQKIWSADIHENYDLPSYPFQDVVHRTDRTNAVNNFMGVNEDFHPVLGRKFDADANVWLSQIDALSRPDLGEHIVQNRAIVPGAVFFEMAMAAAQRAHKSEAVELRDFDITAPLPLLEKSTSDLKTQVSHDASSIVISSRALTSDDPWLNHITCRTGTLSVEEHEGSVLPNIAFDDGDLDARFIYARAQEMGLHYGPIFRMLSHARKVTQNSLEVILNDTERSVLPQYVFDPISMDSIFHGLLGWLGEDSSLPKNIAFVPVHLARMRTFKTGAMFKSAKISIVRTGTKSILADIKCFDVEGYLGAELKGLRFSGMRLAKPFDLNNSAYYFKTIDIQGVVPSNRSERLISQFSIADKVQKTLSEDYMIQEDVTYLLVESICQKIAYDTILKLADENNFLKNNFAFEGNQNYLDVLLNMLELSGLATLENGIWQLDDKAELPDVDLQISNLLIEKPHSVLECAILARLADVSFKIVNDTQQQILSEMIGAEITKAFEIASILAKQKMSIIRQSILELLSDLPDEKQVKIAILLPENNLIDIDHDDVSLLTPDDISSHEMKYDCVVMPLGLPDQIISNQGSSAFSELLIDGGCLVTLEFSNSSLLNILEALSKTSDGISKRHCSDFEDLKVLLEKVGFSEFSSIDLMDSFCGTQLIVTSYNAHSDEASEQTDIIDVSNTEFAFIKHQELIEKFGKVSRHEATDISIFGVDGDYLIHFPVSDPSQDLLEERILYLSEFLQSGLDAKSNIWCVLPHGALPHADGKVDPSQAALWAFLRTAQNEFPDFKIRTIDINDASIVDTDILLALISADTLETEILIEDGTPKALRISSGLPIAESNVFSGSVAYENLKTRLSFPTSGRLNELHWQSANRVAPEDTEIEIEVSATGLNYRDVMWALGVLPEEALEKGFAGATLGIEYAGYVKRVGASVEGIKSGDLVASIGPASFASHIVVDQSKAFKLPEMINPAAAATIPVAFFTAYYSILHLAQLEENEVILIHGAAGGVGLAAVQIAKKAGAKVIGTAGTPTKRALLNSLGVDHVLDSRSLKFANDLEEITNGEGVDVVLNSLASEAMELSLNALRPFGRFIELGKQDFYLNTKIGIRALKENIHYFGVDADQVMASKPDLVTRIFQKIMTHFQEGDYSALPYREFNSDQVVDAFRTMQRSAHIGKIVVKPKTPSTHLSSENQVAFKASSEGFHVIAGGLGGIGLKLAEWLARNGAQKIALLSRSCNISVEAQFALDQLTEKGVVIAILKCDISHREAVHKTLADIRASDKISGVINTAMVLQDTEIKTLSQDILQKTLASKVSGSQHLSDATTDDELEYFVMFSSVASMIGNYGQSAYVAANGFMEGLAIARRNAGLPALAIGWGAVMDAGYLTRDTDKASIVSKFSGKTEFLTADLLNSLSSILAIENNTQIGPVFTITPMSWAPAVNALKVLKNPTHAMLGTLYENAEEHIGFNSLRESLEALPMNKLVKRLNEFITNEIASVLRVSISDLSLNRPIADLGMDSLMSVEFALAAQEALGDDIPMASISSDTMSISDISEKIGKHILSSNVTIENSDSVLDNLVVQHVRTPSSGIEEIYKSR